MNPSIELSMVKANSASIFVIEHASDNFGHASVTASPSKASTSSKGRRSRRRSRLARFSVTRTAHDVKSAEQQQAFIVRQYFAICGPQQNGAQFRRGFLDSHRANSDGEVRQRAFRRDGIKVAFDRT
jgi:hypothetical protein